MADEIKTLEGLEAAVTEDIGGVQGTPEPETAREPVRDSRLKYRVRFAAALPNADCHW